MHGQLGRIVTVAGPGGAAGVVRAGRGRAGSARLRVPAGVQRRRVGTECGPDVLAGDGPLAQQGPRRSPRVDDGRLQTHAGRAGVDDRSDAPVEVGQHMLRTGGRGARGPVRTRCCQRRPAPAQDLQGDRMVGDAHCDRVEPTRHRTGQVVTCGEHDRERTGSEVLEQSPCERCDLARDLRDVRDRRDVDDQRVVRGAPLGGEQSSDGCSVVGAHGESVDGLGRDRDQVTVTQQGRGTLEV